MQHSIQKENRRAPPGPQTNIKGGSGTPCRQTRAYWCTPFVPRPVPPSAFCFKTEERGTENCGQTAGASVAPGGRGRNRVIQQALKARWQSPTDTRLGRQRSSRRLLDNGQCSFFFLYRSAFIEISPGDHRIAIWGSPDTQYELTSVNLDETKLKTIEDPNW